MGEWEFIFAQLVDGFADGRNLDEARTDGAFYQIGHEAGVLLRIERDSDGESSEASADKRS